MPIKKAVSMYWVDIPPFSYFVPRFEHTPSWIALIIVMVTEEMEVENLISQDAVFSGYMTIKPEPHGLSAARQQMRRIAFELDFTEDDMAGFIIAVGEAISNAYRHGTPDLHNNYIYLTWRFADNILTVAVRDEGSGFTPDSPELNKSEYSALSGHGINLMRSGMDMVNFKFDGGATVVLRKKWKTPSHRSVELANTPA